MDKLDYIYRTVQKIEKFIDKVDNLQDPGDWEKDFLEWKELVDKNGTPDMRPLLRKWREEGKDE